MTTPRIASATRVSSSVKPASALPPPAHGSRLDGHAAGQPVDIDRSPSVPGRKHDPAARRGAVGEEQQPVHAEVGRLDGRARGQERRDRGLGHVGQHAGAHRQCCAGRGSPAPRSEWSDRCPGAAGCAPAAAPRRRAEPTSVSTTSSSISVKPRAQLAPARDIARLAAAARRLVRPQRVEIVGAVLARAPCRDRDCPTDRPGRDGLSM